MKIICVGDSWTKGWDIENEDDTWPYVLGRLLGAEVIVGAVNGADNGTITDTALKLIKKHKPDLCIVGWSGVTRYFKSTLFRSEQFSLSYVPPELTEKRAAWFRENSLDNILDNWEYQMSKIEGAGVPVLMFSVFGDKPKRNHLDLTEVSFLEYIANKQGIQFKYSIPIFEFDFLHEGNTVTDEFAKKYFPTTWQYACVEREELRDTENFFNCGHPNEKGHKLWAKYLKEIICQRQMNGAR